MKHACMVIVAAGLAFCGGAVHAQSLADLARQEQERRKSIKDPAPIYTEADVQKNAPLTTAAARPEVPSPASGQAGQPGGAGAEAKPADAANADAAAKDKAEPKDETEWRSRMQQAREELARSRRLLAAMESQLVGMGIQASSAAVAGLPVPDRSRQEEAAREVERLRSEVAKAEAALSRLEDQARSTGIPPGWVR
jgi:hypothetical protein